MHFRGLLSVFFLIILVAGSFLLAGCGSRYTDFFDTVREEVRPRVKLLFELYFGTDSEGNYLTKPDPEARGQERGVQDVVFSRFDEFEKNEQEELRDVDEFMKKLLGEAKNVNDKLEKFKGSADEVLQHIERIIVIGAGVYERVQ